MQQRLILRAGYEGGSVQIVTTYRPAFGSPLNLILWYCTRCQKPSGAKLYQSGSLETSSSLSLFTL